MNTKIAIATAFLLLVAGIIVAFKTSGPADADKSTTSSTPPTTTSRSQRQPADAAQSSFRFLQKVTTLDLSDAPTFAEIQSRTAQLSFAQIEDLLKKHTSHEGLSGWLRSALWAELGRRNHRASFENLLGNSNETDSRKFSFARDQAIFAFLRGRIDQLDDFDGSLNSTFNDIKSLADLSHSSDWQSRTFKGLFEKLTRLDPAAAWALLQEDSYTEDISVNLPSFHDSQNTSALKGFFSVLPSEELAKSYLEKWQPAMKTPEAVKAYQNYQNQLNSRLSGFISTPATEVIVTQALASLARFNPEGAVAWLSENESNPEKPDYNRIHEMWRALATNYPEEAMEILSRPEFVDARRSSIGWLIQQDYSLAPQVISETPKASHQTQIFHNIIHSAGSNHVNDFFPTPAGPNRLPNFQQRRDYLTEAINLATFSEKQRENMFKSFNREFANRLSTE